MSLMVDRIRLLSDVRSEEAKTLDIWLDKENCSPEKIQMLRGMLQKHPGEIPVQLIIRPNQESQVSIKLDEKISAHPALIDEF